jgi:putative transposase
MRTRYLNAEESKLSIRNRCALLGINRSNVYYKKVSESKDTLAIKGRIEEIWEERNNKGSRVITAELRTYDNLLVNRKRVQRLMRMLNIKGILPKRNLSKVGDIQYKYPYILSGMHIYKSNLVWATDLTYCKLPTGMMYVITILDIFSRQVLAHEITNTLEAVNCISCLDKAIDKYGKPIIFNSDQGSQFTCHEWINKLTQNNIVVSMDGKGRWADNVYVERFWRTLKYECIFLLGIETVADLKYEVAKYIQYYNSRRLHSRLDYKTPQSVYNASMVGDKVDDIIYCEYPPLDERTKMQRKLVLPSVSNYR